MIKFAHFADIHLGGWRQAEMQALNFMAFQQAIDICIKEKVKFVIFAGDIFDSAIPSIDILKEAISEFKKLNDRGIKCYLVPGSHDYSVTGKTFLDVIEKAGFCKNVSLLEEYENEINLRIAEDEDLNIAFAGIPGKKASNEIEYFKKLKIPPLDEKKFKIFVFHSTLTEAKPEEMDFIDSVDMKDLPEGFDYYAGGHLHLNFEATKKEAPVIYPGPLFPNNIEELEKLKKGVFYVIEVEKNKVIKKEKKEIKLKEILNLEICADNLSSDQLNFKVLEEIEKQELRDKIVILRIKGRLSSGKTSDLDWNKINQKIQDKGAYVLLRSTSGLTTEEMKIEIDNLPKNLEDMEKRFIKEYQEKNHNFREFFSFINPLLSLDMEPHEFEKKENFQTRVLEEASKILKINL